jgi:nitrogen PTS system EIIA component
MKFLNLLGQRIYLDMDVCNTDELFEKTANLTAIDTHVNAQDIKKHLSMREHLGSTALGMGVAIPHGRIQNLQHTIITFVRTKQSIDFKAPDNIGVRIFMCILVPEHAKQEHLNLLSYIANMLSDDHMRQVFEAALCVEDIKQILQVYAYKTATELS